MPKLLISLGRKAHVNNKEISIQDMHTYYIADESKDFHTSDGFITAADLKKKDGSTVKSNKGREFIILTASFMDAFQKIARAPQIIPLKDVGSIITFTGINKDSKVVDAGAGSGGLACVLAHLCKEVTTYEIRDDFLKVAEKNKADLGLKNLKIKHKDVTQGIDEKNVDLVTLDLPAPWLAVAHAVKALAVGGYLVSYSPTIPQVADTVNEINKAPELLFLKTIEITEREWDVDDRKIRPKTQTIGHSGFLTFARKIRA